MIDRKRGIDLMAEYVFLSKYSQVKEDGELESWEEANKRIYDMHRMKLYSRGVLSREVESVLAKALAMENDKVILSSQRSRQFASTSPNSGILKHEAKMYNCTSTYVDRLEVFSEIMYLLLCGAGVGYSLSKKYISKLPEVKTKSGRSSYFEIPDSIEGWADSIDVLIRNLYQGSFVFFDYSNIRPKGALIDGKFLAPGHEKLKRTHEMITNIFNKARGRQLSSLELHDVICSIASSVVSGGVRRSAMIALFDKDDVEMRECKKDQSWYLNEETKDRAYANNSVLMTSNDPLTLEEIKDFLTVVRNFGEPGFIKVKDKAYTVNPCGEIVMLPTIDGTTGFAFCNLVEINAQKIKSAEEFYEACRTASQMATIQAVYTDFKYLSLATKKIAQRDRAVGVSITGFLGANNILTNEVLRKGAKIVADANYEMAELLDIHNSRACTTIKPSGNASVILGLYYSGIHPAHASKYIRRVTITKHDPEYIALKDTPLVRDISDDSAQISFPIDMTDDDVEIITKDDMSATEHLDLIFRVKENWIDRGIRRDARIKSLFGEKPHSNNVSATVEVADGEWDEVAEKIYENYGVFTGVSLLPKIGDKVYPTAPFVRVDEDTQAEYDAICEYIANNDIDFASILKNRLNVESGALTAMACSGGSCELK